MIQILSIFKNALSKNVLFKNLRETKIPILGRWQIEKCNTKLSNKIKLANEDHCGTCTQTEIIKNELKKTNSSTYNDINIF
jgi:hypothetical protein